jgi:hypothetical protein
MAGTLSFAQLLATERRSNLLIPERKGMQSSRCDLSVMLFPEEVGFKKQAHMEMVEKVGIVGKTSEGCLMIFSRTREPISFRPRFRLVREKLRPSQLRIG